MDPTVGVEALWPSFGAIDPVSGLEDGCPRSHVTWIPPLDVKCEEQSRRTGTPLNLWDPPIHLASTTTQRPGKPPVRPAVDLVGAYGGRNDEKGRCGGYGHEWWLRGCLVFLAHKTTGGRPHSPPWHLMTRKSTMFHRRAAFPSPVHTVGVHKQIMGTEDLEGKA